MKVQRLFAALLFACSAISLAWAQEPKADVPQQMQREVQAEAAPAQAAAVPEVKDSAQAPAGPAADGVATQAAPALASSPLNEAAAGLKAAQEVAVPADPADPARHWADQFIYGIKATDVLMAVFTGLLLLIAAAQLRRLRETADSTRQTAQAADKTARAAEDALVTGQRAFMFLKEFKTFLNYDESSKQFSWSIHPVWENSGNTPTKGLAINTTYRLLDEPLPADYDFPASGSAMIPTIAAPKALVEAAPGTLSAQDLEAVQQGRKYFYVWGWAEYHDIFDGTKQHTTRFCNQLMQVIGNPAAPISEHNMVQLMFGFHSANNHAD